MHHSSHFKPDTVLRRIADYVCNYQPQSSAAYRLARVCLLDAIGCALYAHEEPECTRLLGPVVPGTVVPYGARVPGTSFRLDPVTAAFNIGLLVRWHDFSDALTGAQPSHPSDNIGALLAVADHLSQLRRAEGKPPMTMRNLMAWLIKAYEIHGALGLKNSFYDVGLDQVPLVEVASAAVTARMLGADRAEVISAVSNALADGVSLAIYRRAPHAGTRKNWAGPDGSARGVQLALRAVKGESGYPTVLSTPLWGLHAVFNHDRKIKLPKSLGCFVVNNVQFKVNFPTVFNSQTAAECAVGLHAVASNRINRIKRVVIHAHGTSIRLNGRVGPLRNSAERDHSLQYVVAIGLLHGMISADMYQDNFAIDPRIDLLRSKMVLVEDTRYTADYVNPKILSSANAVEVQFEDGTTTGKMVQAFPIGHPRRRAEAMPLLEQKFRGNVARRLPENRLRDDLMRTCMSQTIFERTAVDEFMAMLSL